MTAVTARAPSVCGKGSGPLDGLSCLVRIPSRQSSAVRTATKRSAAGSRLSVRVRALT
jgi:hypothetical protein